MLTGPALGKAIDQAIRLKGVPKTTVADHFGIKGPSIYDWIKHGRVGKQHLEELVAYFSDVVSPSHWGLIGPSLASQSARLTGEIILASYQEAVEKFEAQGLNKTSFKPLKEPEHAELLALSIIARLTAPDSMGKIAENVEVGRGSQRKGAKGSRTTGEHRQEEVGSEGRAKAGQRKKRAA